jgi:hypothetical protein
MRGEEAPEPDPRQHDVPHLARWSRRRAGEPEAFPGEPAVTNLNDGRFERADIGREHGVTVSPDYPIGDNDFTGRINRVQVDIGTADHDHVGR